MTGGITRRELIFRKLPTAVAAVAGSCTFLGAANVLAEPIQRHKMSLKEYTNHLLLQHWDRFLKLREKEFSEFCGGHFLDKTDGEVAHGYVASSFFHELIRRNGILGNRYMLIGERPERILKVDGEILALLTEKELELRGPGRMLSDMFSGKPKYALEDGSRIHCFGDCDEYEMAYATIVKAVGINAKVVMTEASHVNTQIGIGEKKILVDNTRNMFGQGVDCKGRCKDYKTGELGFIEPQKASMYINRINRMARAGTNVRIYPKGEKRVDEKIDSALRRWEKATEVSAYQEETGLLPSSQRAHTEEEGTTGSR